MKKTITSLLLVGTILCTTAIGGKSTIKAMSPIDAAYSTAYTSTVAALNTKDYKDIGKARQAIDEAKKLYNHPNYSSWNGMLNNAEVQAYKEAYEATVRAFNYGESNLFLDYFQNLVTDARLKVKKLSPANPAYPTWNSMIDSKQNTIFVYLLEVMGYIETSARVEGAESFLIAQQKDLNYIKDTVNIMIKSDPFYATTFSSIVDKYQQMKIEECVKLINTAKQTKDAYDVLKTRAALKDMLTVSSNDAVLAFTKAIEKDFISIENEVIPNKELYGFYDHFRIYYIGNSTYERGSKRSYSELESWRMGTIDFNIYRPQFDHVKEEEYRERIFTNAEKALGPYKTVYISGKMRKDDSGYLEVRRLADNFVLQRLYENGKIESFIPTILTQEQVDDFNNTTDYKPYYYR